MAMTNNLVRLLVRYLNLNCHEINAMVNPKTLLSACLLPQSNRILWKSVLPFGFSTQRPNWLVSQWSRPTPNSKILSAYFCDFPNNNELVVASYSSSERKKPRHRQHVNPLSRLYQKPLELDKDWLSTAFDSAPQRPLVIDIGCSKGAWALSYAVENPHVNVLGLEIRRPMVDIALQRKKTLDLRNAHFLASNAGVDLSGILQNIASHNIHLKCLCISFPDPHFKSKHHKRRVVQPEFVSAITAGIGRGTELYIQSDIKELEEEMCELFLNSGCFDLANGYDLERLSSNPPAFLIQTDREVSCLSRGLDIYRALLVRN